MSTTRKIKAEYIDGISSKINYILKSSFNDYITGFNRYADSGTRPVDGTGGSPANFTIAKTTTDPIQGEGSLLLTKSNSTSIQGQGFSYDFTIPRGQRGRVQEISFDYEIVSGTYSGGTLSTDSDLIGYIYRTTATGRLVEPSIIKLDGSVSGVSYSFRSQFQTDSDATGYRLIIHAATTSAIDYSIKFDNFYVGPAQQVSGASISNPQPHTGLTIQGGGTLTNNRVQYWREGKWLLMQGTVVLGTTTGSTFQLSLPSGLTVSSDTIGTSTNIVVGQLTRYVAVNPSHKTFVVKAVGNRTYLTVGITSLTDTTNPNTDLTGGAFTNNDEISIFAKVPISGLGATATLGQDADTRVHAMRATKASQTGLTVSAWNTISFTAAQVTETGGLWNASTNEVIIPVSGWYDISVRAQGNVTSLEVMYLGYRVDGGADFAYGGNYSNATVASVAVVSGFDQRYFTAGQKIQFRANPSVSTQINDPVMSVQRSAGPSQIQATEHVGLSVNTTSTAIGSALATIVFTNKVLDTHGSYNTSTGIWTCPATATYCIEGAIFATGTFGSDTRVNCMIRVNSVDTVAALVRTSFNPTGGAGSGIAVTTRRILAGQTVVLQGATQATSPAYSSDITLTYLNITKVGL